MCSSGRHANASLNPPRLALLRTRPHGAVIEHLGAYVETTAPRPSEGTYRPLNCGSVHGAV